MPPGRTFPGLHSRADWLPEFCSAPVIFSLLALAAATLLIIQIAPSASGESSLGRVPVALLFLFIFCFLVVTVLCQARKRLIELPSLLAVGATYLIVLTGAALGSAMTYWLDHALDLNATIESGRLAQFIGRNLAVIAIVWGIALRHFYVRGQWQQQVRAHALAQFEALQARIRPHFLFNSMNTIASLVRDRPDDAERAIEDLSELFRVALRAGTTITLGDELALVRRYLDIEKLRLGARLEIQEETSDAPLDLSVPALMIQPLVENAILHGVQTLEAGGRVELTIRRDGTAAVIEIRNPTIQAPSRRHRGSGTALDNIRRRLAHHFGDAARLEIEKGEGYHHVRLTLPIA